MGNAEGGTEGLGVGDRVSGIEKGAGAERRRE